MKKISYRSKMKCLALLWLMIMPLSVHAAAAIGDYDGDGRADLLVLRRNVGETNYNWYFNQSRDGFATRIWGGSVLDVYTDGAVRGDYDGDGRWDVGIVRFTGSNNPYVWYIINSRDNSLNAFQWGISGDIFVSQDYDGDGRTDPAVFRFGRWYIRQSSDNQMRVEQFGVSNDEPFAGGDYDGDGRADLAVVRYASNIFPGEFVTTTFYLQRSSDRTWQSYDLGDGRYTGVLSGDYDGDGRADVAIWQGNLWLWLRSSDNKLEGVRFGKVESDYPAAADYDGDGRTDPAVYRRGAGSCAGNQAQSYFYILQSRDGFKIAPWGLACDTYPAVSSFKSAVGF